MKHANTIAVTVVIPVFNEESGLQALFDRLYPVLDADGQCYEVIFVDDGSSDRSVAVLREQFEARPDTTRVIILKSNCGQHRAILAGFAEARGDTVITLDADLQNPPEDIPVLLEAIAQGHDYVGTIRVQRQDAAWRRWASRLMNQLRERMTNIRMTDQGCMMRAYARPVVDAVNHCEEIYTFVPALAYTFARNPTEVRIGHADRHSGTSKYSLYSLMRLNFDLMTGFSLVPLQLFSMVGMAVSMLSGLLFALIILRRIFMGSEAEGVFTLFAVAFLLIGLSLFGIGIVGEYVGRIYQEVRHRPRWLIAAVLQAEPDRDNAFSASVVRDRGEGVGHPTSAASRNPAPATSSEAKVLTPKATEAPMAQGTPR